MKTLTVITASDALKAFSPGGGELLSRGWRKFLQGVERIVSIGVMLALPAT